MLIDIGEEKLGDLVMGFRAGIWLGACQVMVPVLVRLRMGEVQVQLLGWGRWVYLRMRMEVDGEWLC